MNAAMITSIDAAATTTVAAAVDLVAVLNLDRVEGINLAAIDSDVVAVVDPGLDMIAVIDLNRGGGENIRRSDGGRRGWTDGDRLSDGFAGCISSSQLGSGSDDRLGYNGGEVPNCGDEEGLKVEGRRRLSVSRLEGRTSKCDGWTIGHEVEASEKGRPGQSSSITFDKYNPSGSVLSGAAAKDSEPLGLEPTSNPMAQPGFTGNELHLDLDANVSTPLPSSPVHWAPFPQSRLPASIQMIQQS